MRVFQVISQIRSLLQNYFEVQYIIANLKEKLLFLTVSQKTIIEFKLNWIYIKKICHKKILCKIILLHNNVFKINFVT